MAITTAVAIIIALPIAVAQSSAQASSSTVVVVAACIHAVERVLSQEGPTMPLDIMVLLQEPGGPMANDEAFVQLKPRAEEADTALDAELLEIIERNAATSRSPISAFSGDNWDAPFDLRIARPRAVDLRALWVNENLREPGELAAGLGPKRPILLTHVVTPFPHDGDTPARVWSLGYEIAILDADANTVSVAPSNEVFKIADLGQSIDLGIDSESQRSHRAPVWPYTP